MTWNSRYIPPDPTQWRGRNDSPPKACFFQIVKMLDLMEKPKARFGALSPHIKSRFAFLGFRCDEGIRRNFGRVGAAEGPTAIRHALARLPVLKHDFELFDAGNIVCLDGDLEASQAALAEIVSILLRQKINPIVIGGGHELAWGHYQGITDAFVDRPLGIINFDSHFDMRPLLADGKGTSGTPFLQIAEACQQNDIHFDYNCVGIQRLSNIRPLIETAKKYKTNIIWADEIHSGQHEKCTDFIDRIIDQNEIIYLSICLDVFSSAFAPGVSASHPLGLTPWHLIPLIRTLAASGKVISYDIAEMSPRYDIDQRTAKLAASLIFEFIHHHNEEPREW